MDTINIRNNRRILAVIATFLLFSLFANIYYYQTGKDILTQSTSRESTAVYANETTNSLEHTNIEETIVEEKKLSKEEIAFNSKVEKIRKYLSNRGAPLAKYAEEFVKAADHYGIDYRLVAAISIIESSGGKHNFRPHNAWGWGKSGFKTWKDGIWAVSEGLSKYYAKGATTPQTIAPSYCPPSADAWASKVSYVMRVISNQ
jgi:hypothetical protein